MRCHLLSLLVVAPSLLTAQAPYPIGTRDVSWPNTTGQGSASLTARVHYPATVAGSNAPVRPQSGGWPVVVFLHGFALTGTSYAALGNAWAAEGYVVVLSNTAQFDNVGQERDGRALFLALQAANATSGGPFAGAFDLQRVGLAGHSMGGGNVGNVLASNPGYRCGLALAPVPPRGANAAAVAVPLAIVVGNGDTITPPSSNAEVFYRDAVGYRDGKSLLLLNNDCDHTNVAGLFLSGGAATEVFARVSATALGFWARYLRDEAGGLEAVLGVSVATAPRVVQVRSELAQPQVWAAAALQPGVRTRISIAAEPGFGGALAANAFAAATPTPIGDLLLDPASVFVAIVGTAANERRIDDGVTVPNSPAFVGTRLAVQAAGRTRDADLQLGATALLVVVP